MVVSIHQHRKRQQTIDRTTARSTDRHDDAVGDLDPPGARRCVRRETDQVLTSDGAGFVDHAQGATLGAIRSGFGGRNARLNTSLAGGEFGSSNDVAMVAIAEVKRVSLTSPRPSSLASGVSISDP